MSKKSRRCGDRRDRRPDATGTDHEDAHRRTLLTGRLAGTVNVRGRARARVRAWSGGAAPTAIWCSDVPDLRRIMPYVMRTRNESTVYFEQRIDVGNAERFVRAFNEAHPETRATLFHVLHLGGRAGARRVPEPEPVRRRRSPVPAQGHLDLLLAKQRMQKGAPLIVLKREFEPDESFAAMVAAMRDAAAHRPSSAARRTSVDGEMKLVLMLPGFLRRARLASLYRVLEANGMFPQLLRRQRPALRHRVPHRPRQPRHRPGVPPPLRVRERSASSACSAGRAPSRSRDPNTGRLERKRIATIRWSFDERIEDGLYAGYGSSR